MRRHDGRVVLSAGNIRRLHEQTTRGRVLTFLGGLTPSRSPFLNQLLHHGLVIQQILRSPTVIWNRRRSYINPELLIQRRENFLIVNGIRCVPRLWCQTNKRWDRSIHSSVQSRHCGAERRSIVLSPFGSDRKPTQTGIRCMTVFQIPFRIGSQSGPQHIERRRVREDPSLPGHEHRSAESRGPGIGRSGECGRCPSDAAM